MTIKYTPDHEWLQINSDGTATVGITHHAQDALGDVVFVDLPAVGATFAPKDVAGVVESVKAAADVYMPVTGEMLKSTKPCATTLPWQQRPHWRWLVLQVKLSNPAEMDGLMDKTALRRSVEERLRRAQRLAPGPPKRQPAFSALAACRPSFAAEHHAEHRHALSLNSKTRPNSMPATWAWDAEQAAMLSAIGVAFSSGTD